MARISKKANVFDEKIIQRFIEKKVISSADFDPCRLSKELFIMIALYTSAVMIILILFISINYFTSVLLKERAIIRNSSLPMIDSFKKLPGSITYAADKSKYGLNEEISLSITNSSNESIFLAPCQYFNKFEKKESNSWKEVVIDNCKGTSVKSSGEFERIPTKEKQNISAVILGEGVWRGVSDIYMDCQKADISACKSKKVVYSNEFKIETKNAAVPDVL